jgi:fructose-1,6-bisphosphatase/inositol monophosphatase family enzyme
MTTVDVDEIAALIRDVADEEILPRFRRLQAEDIQDKGGGDPVTEADLATERRLTQELQRLTPGSVVVGEEAVHENPKLLSALDSDDLVWVLDPLDGTKNFTEGKDLFVTMLALVQDGETIASWIYRPTTGDMAYAEIDEGAYLNFRRLRTVSSRPTNEMRASVHTKYITGPLKAKVEAAVGAFKSNDALYCAGLVYLNLASGLMDCALYWRTNVWDHAPGALILSEAGGRVAYVEDGHQYGPSSTEKLGIVAVANPNMWDAVTQQLMR